MFKLVIKICIFLMLEKYKIRLAVSGLKKKLFTPVLFF